jgi:glutathione S-transferase
MSGMAVPELTLYDLAGANPSVRFSPHCWKTRMALAHKGIAARFEPWRFADRLKNASVTRVPVLLHGGQPISDSWRIAHHLDEVFPDRPLFERNTEGVTRFVNSWADSLIPILARVIVLDVFYSLDSGDQPYFRETRERFLGGPLESIVADQPGRLRDFRLALESLRQTITRQPFVNVPEPGYADYCAFGLFMWGRCCSQAELSHLRAKVLHQEGADRWRSRLGNETRHGNSSHDGHVVAVPKDRKRDGRPGDRLDTNTRPIENQRQCHDGPSAPQNPRAQRDEARGRQHGPKRVVKSTDGNFDRASSDLGRADECSQCDRRRERDVP